MLEEEFGFENAADAASNGNPGLDETRPITLVGRAITPFGFRT